MVIHPKRVLFRDLCILTGQKYRGEAPVPMKLDCNLVNLVQTGERSVEQQKRKILSELLDGKKKNTKGFNRFTTIENPTIEIYPQNRIDPKPNST